MTERRRLEDVPDDFAGCAKPCWGKEIKHTYVWGSCEHAVKPPAPEPRISVWRVVTYSDGDSALVQSDLPAVILLPWSTHLSVEERQAMLWEVFTSDDPAEALAGWMAAADPKQAEVLTQARELSDYVDAPRPLRIYDEFTMSDGSLFRARRSGTARDAVRLNLSKGAQAVEINISRNDAHNVIEALLVFINEIQLEGMQRQAAEPGAYAEFHKLIGIEDPDPAVEGGRTDG